ncbi:DUF397 domain-containing protein [Streptomyces sp. MMCC 100]|uniref:DUF397 domain-containing protein n=1 Tax=Streptomyces sp. MMCC 100 TaxID=3163555 RepID=UPI003599511F
MGCCEVPARRLVRRSEVVADCVEVATPDESHVLVRDSKNPTGPRLSLTPRPPTDTAPCTRAGTSTTATADAHTP